MMALKIPVSTLLSVALSFAISRPMAALWMALPASRIKSSIASGSIAAAGEAPLPLETAKFVWVTGVDTVTGLLTDTGLQVGKSMNHENGLL